MYPSILQHHLLCLLLPLSAMKQHCPLLFRGKAEKTIFLPLPNAELNGAAPALSAQRRFERHVGATTIAGGEDASNPAGDCLLTRDNAAPGIADWQSGAAMRLQ